jgi:hypothetical protein
MIDRNARDALAGALAGMLAGEVATKDFNRLEAMRSDDRAIEEIWLFGDGLYDDMGSASRLIGEMATSPEAEEMGARCVLFLRSDLEYEWPPHPRYLFFYWYLSTGLFALTACLGSATLGYLGLIGPAACSLAVCVIGIAGFGCIQICHKLRLRRELEAYWNAGDKDVWPFLSKAHYDRALVAQPRLV